MDLLLAIKSIKSWAFLGLLLNCLLLCICCCFSVSQRKHQFSGRLLVVLRGACACRHVDWPSHVYQSLFRSSHHRLRTRAKDDTTAVLPTSRLTKDARRRRRIICRQHLRRSMEWDLYFFLCFTSNNKTFGGETASVCACAAC